MTCHRHRPNNANRVYLGGSPALAFGISTNGGASFTKSENGLHADSHVIEVAPSNPQVVYFGSDGGIYRSNNAGANWTSLSNSTFSATQFMSIAIHPSDPNFTIGGTQDNGLRCCARRHVDTYRLWRRRICRD